jgi:hypothetical protein
MILGLTPRSGTNLLYRLLLEHPDCAPARQPGEDFVVHGVDHLVRYVDSVASMWNPDWNREGERATDLARALGRGWLAHLRPDADAAAFVTKTPSVRGIAHLHRFLPEARVLALVRDGRDVAESGARSFGWTYGEAFRGWAAAAEELVSHTEAGSASGTSIVRFESLVRDRRAEMGRVLEACGLDGDRFDFEASSKLPVYGSSTAAGDGREIDWDPVPAPEGFDPVGRWSTWDGRLRARYDRVCGRVSARLGYPREPLPGGRLRRGAIGLAASLDRR